MSREKEQQPSADAVPQRIHEFELVYRHLIRLLH